MTPAIERSGMGGSRAAPTSTLHSRRGASQRAHYIGRTTDADPVRPDYSEKDLAMAATHAVRPKRVSRVSDVPNIMRQGRITPWLYLGPALFVMILFIVYPALNTLYLSFRNINGTDWATAA